MKIAYFHRLTFEETEQRFKEEAERMGIELVFIKYKDLLLESNSNPTIPPFNYVANEKSHPGGSKATDRIQNKDSLTAQAGIATLQNDKNQPFRTIANRITFKGIDLENFDIWFFRSVGSELEWSKLLQLYARDNNIPIVDDYILTEGVLKRFKSTMGYILAKNGINYPQTTYFNTFKQVKKYLGVEDVTKQSTTQDTCRAEFISASTTSDTEILNQVQDDTCSTCECGGNCGCGGCLPEESLNVIASGAEQSDTAYPFIIKMSSGGRHGMSTFFIQKESDLFEMEITLKERKERAIKEGKVVPQFRGFLLQEYIPNDGDFRVMTVGYKCIGGFKRAPKEEKLVLNKSKGKSTGMEKLPDDVVKTAEDAAKVLEIEVAGTDLVRHKDTGEVYIVEVNEAPQFKVFEKRTKINAPKMILEYLIEKAKVN